MMNIQIVKSEEADVLALSAKIQSGELSREYIQGRIIDQQRAALIWLMSGELTEYGRDTVGRLVGSAHGYSLALTHAEIEMAKRKETDAV